MAFRLSRTKLQVGGKGFRVRIGVERVAQIVQRRQFEGAFQAEQRHRRESRDNVSSGDLVRNCAIVQADTVSRNRHSASASSGEIETCRADELNCSMISSTALNVVRQDGAAGQKQGVARGFRRDVGVAVAVAADPRAEAQHVGQFAGRDIADYKPCRKASAKVSYRRGRLAIRALG